MRVSIVLILCSLVLTLTANAQDVRERRPLRVKVSSHSDGNGSGWSGEVWEAMRNELTLRGATLTDKPELVLLVGALEVKRAEGNEIVLSVVTMHSLPDTIIQFNKEAEAFYLTISEEKRAELPAEGAAMRQYMSEEFIRGFMLPQEHDIIVVPRSDLDHAISEIVETFIERYGYYGLPDQR